MPLSPELALRDHIEAMLRETQSPGEFCVLAESLHFQGWTARARQHLERAGERWPGSALLLLSSARLFYAQGRLTAAKQAAEQALDREPLREVGELLAVCLLALAEWTQARGVWLAAQQLPRCRPERLPECEGFRIPLSRRCLVLERGRRRNLLIDGEPRSLLDDVAVSSMLRTLHFLKQAFDWPITGLVAPEAQMQPVAALLSQAWNVPWTSDRISQAGWLWLALAPEGLPCSGEPGWTFALAAPSSDELLGREPDILGTTTPSRPCWVSLGELQLPKADVISEPGLRSEARQVAEGFLPEGLHQRGCWLEQRPSPSERFLCERLVSGDLRWLDWFSELQLHSEAVGAAVLEALQHTPDRQLVELALECPSVSVEQLWSVGREVQWILLHDGSLTREQRAALQMMAWESDDDELREAALEARVSHVTLSPKALSRLRLEVPEEAALWVDALSPAQATDILLDGPNPRELAVDLLGKAEPRVSLCDLAATWLQSQDRRTEGAAVRFLVRARDRRALPALEADRPMLWRRRLPMIAELAPERAQVVALTLLESEPEAALNCLRALGSPAGLDICRQRARTPGADASCILYLQTFGAPEEEMLETLATRDRAAAFPLVDRGHLEFLEVIQRQLEGEDSYFVARQVLRWGNPHGVALLTDFDLRELERDPAYAEAARAALESRRRAGSGSG